MSIESLLELKVIHIYYLKFFILNITLLTNFAIPPTSAPRAKINVFPSGIFSNFCTQSLRFETVITRGVFFPTD